MPIIPLVGQLPDWRETLAQNQIPLPATLSAQPQLSYDRWALWLAGGLLLIWTMGQPHSDQTLKRRVRWALKILLPLILIALLAMLAGVKHPLHPQAEVFSYFPNRNQMATLAAIAALLGLGMLMVERRPHWRGMAAALLICALGVLALGPSRGGWVSLAIGLIFVLRAQRLGILLAIPLVVGASLIVIWGLPGWESRHESQTPAEIRATLYQDTARLIAENPLGVGLGNFEFVFPHYQSITQGERLVRHPENDWLWFISEGGLPTLLILISLLGWKSEKLRRSGIAYAILAAMIAASLWDVPGHRLALILLTAGILAPTLSHGQGTSLLPHPRLWAILPVGALVLYLATHGQISRASESLAEAIPTRAYPQLRAAAHEVIQLRPLDYQAYATIAQADILWARNNSEGARNYQRAMMLHPKLPLVPYRVGFVWQEAGAHGRAVAAWRESLRRTSSPLTEDYFNRILRHGEITAAQAATLCQGQPNLWERLLEDAPAPQVAQIASQMAAEERYLWQIKSEKAFERWLTYEPIAVLSYLQSHGAPLPWRARALAATGATRQAIELLMPYLPVPPAPQDRYPDLSSAEVMVRLRIVPENAPAYIETIAARLPHPDLQTDLETLAKLPMAPPSVRYAAAQKEAANGRWHASWQLLQSLITP
jgi:hypothetical protein